MKKFLAFLFAFVMAALLCVAPALSQPAPQDEVAWFKPDRYVNDLVLAPNGQVLYIIDEDSVTGNSFINIINTSNGTQVNTILPDNKTVRTRILTKLVISDDGKYLVAINEKDHPLIWVINLQTGEQKTITDTILNKGRGFNDVAISHDGNTITAIPYGPYLNSSLIAFDRETGQRKYYYYRFNDAEIEGDLLFERLAYSPDGSFLAIVGATTHGIPPNSSISREIQICDPDSFQIRKRIPVDFKENLPLTIKFSQITGKMGLGHENKIDFYDYTTYQLVGNITFPNPVEYNYDFGFDNSGQKVINFRQEKHKIIFQTYNINPPKTLYLYDTVWVQNPLLSADNQYIFGCNYNGIYKLIAYWEPSGVGIETKPKDQLLLYPNPAINMLKIEINLLKAENCSVNITDVTGKLVANIFKDIMEGKKNLSYNTQNLPVGTYYVTLTTKQNVITKQFVRIN